MDKAKRGEIWWVDFSHERRGAEQTGRRPALVIQNDVGNENSPTTIVAAIGSGQQEKELPILVKISSAESGLPRDSVVNLAQIRTIDQSRLGNKSGNLTQEKMRKVDKAIKISLGLSS